MEPLNAIDAQRYAGFKLWTPFEAALLLSGCQPLPRGHIPEPDRNTPAFNLIQAIQHCGPSKNLETPHPPERWMLWYSEYLAGRDFPEFSEKAMQAWDSVAVESQIARQARRYQMGIDADLKMPTDDYAPMPRGIGKLAKIEKISRQAFTEDLKAHIRRAFPKK